MMGQHLVGMGCCFCLLGLADVSLKQWFSNKKRFADMFNAVIFDGERVVEPEELVEINSESNIIISLKNELSATEDESADDTEDKKKTRQYNVITTLL